MAAGALMCSACSDAFEPMAPGGPPFTINGYLDAGADTQWIRVTVRRNTLVASPAPGGVAVSLEKLGSGRVIALRDTAAAYVNMMGSEGLYAHDFWTTERIESGASYRFRAVGRDGSVAESVLQIPHDYKLEVWVLTSGLGSSPYVRIEGVKHLPYMINHAYNDCIPPGDFRSAIPMGPDTVADVRLVDARGLARSNPAPHCGVNEMTWREVQVVASDAPWPYHQVFSGWGLGSLSSNITGATGSLGGVLSKRIPVESCMLPTGLPPAYCKLLYDSTTATLRGSVSGVSPTLLPLIDLNELDPPGGGKERRTRTARLDAQGSFRVGALRPGRHELIIVLPGYEPVFDTLQFTAGKQTDYRVTLQAAEAASR